MMIEKKCVVIGASGDIGSAITLQLASDGFQFVLHYHRNQQKMDELIEKLEDSQLLDVIQADLSQSDGLAYFLSRLPDDIDHLVIASGRAHIGLLQEVHDDELDEMIHLHVKAPLAISKHLLPFMLHKKYGQIVLITSIWGEVGASCEVVYSTVKGSQNSFIQALAKEVGPSGIRVNGVSPGFIDTKMNQEIKLSDQQAIFEEIPLQRPGQPEEVAKVVEFILSNKASYITGEIIRVNGGW